MNNKPNQPFQDGEKAMPSDGEDLINAASKSEMAEDRPSAEGLAREIKAQSKSKDAKESSFRTKKNKAPEEPDGLDIYSIGGFKYKLPGKRQRVLIGSVVLGLNLLLVAATLLYFINPGFKEFIYTVGR